MLRLWEREVERTERGQRDGQGAVKDCQGPTPGQSSHQPHCASQDPHLQPWALAPPLPWDPHGAAPIPPSPALRLPSTQAGLARAVPAAWPWRQAQRAVCRVIARRGWLRSRSSAVISHVPISSSCPARGRVRGGTRSAEPTRGGWGAWNVFAQGRGSPIPGTTMCCFTQGWQTLSRSSLAERVCNFMPNPRNQEGKPRMNLVWVKFSGKISLGHFRAACNRVCNAKEMPCVTSRLVDPLLS